MKKVGTLLLMLMPVTACAQPIPAAYCATVAAHGKEASDRLIALFDTYAATERFKADRSHPMGPVYYNTENTIDVSARIGFGPHGSVVTLFSQNTEETAKAVQNLKAFIATSIEPHFSVKQCSEVKGFENPVKYGWSKREGAT